MLRISKIADYGTKILLAMVAEPQHLYTASELAEKTQVALPTVSKVLKLLSRAAVLQSQRGSQGGYQLARPASEINLAEVIKILDGDIAMTECEQHHSNCSLEARCAAKSNWSVINKMILDLLRGISLQQMQRPMHRESPLKFHQRLPS